MGFHCPICLRVAAHAPIRQHCGHALCFHCTHQAMSTIGGCPLCRTQLLFGGAQSLQMSGPGTMDLGFASPSQARETTDLTAVAHVR